MLYVSEDTTIDEIMYSAIEKNNLELVKTLLPLFESGALDNNSKSLLYAAIEFQNMKIFDCLIEKLDANIVDFRGFNLLMQVITYYDDWGYHDIENIMKYIKDINLQCNTGKTALDMVLSQIGDDELNPDKYIKTIKMFVKHGADPCLETKTNSAAIYSVIDGYPTMELLEILIPYCKDYIDIGSFTSMIIENTEHEEIYDMVELLIPHIKNINELTENHTCLWHVLNDGVKNQDVIELLKENGALSKNPKKIRRGRRPH